MIFILYALSGSKATLVGHAEKSTKPIPKVQNYPQGGIRKRSLFEKGSFSERQFSRDSNLVILDSRKPSESGNARRIRPVSRERIPSAMTSFSRPDVLQALDIFSGAS